MTSKSRRRLRRRLSAAMLLLIGLLVAGGLAATLTPKPQVAVADEQSLALLRTGKQLFETSCVTCHGANLQGVPDRGPSLIGVGEAAVYFQVSTGRMPAMRGEAQAPAQGPHLRPAPDRRARRLRPGQRRRTDGPARRQRRGRAGLAARQRRRPRRRPVPAQLRVVPQLHRQGRRAVVGQVCARHSTRPNPRRSSPRC